MNQFNLDVAMCRALEGKILKDCSCPAFAIDPHKLKRIEKAELGGRVLEGEAFSEITITFEDGSKANFHTNDTLTLEEADD